MAPPEHSQEHRAAGPSVPAARSKPTLPRRVEDPHAIHLRVRRRSRASRHPNRHCRPTHHCRLIHRHQAKAEAPPRFLPHLPTIPFGCCHHRPPIRKLKEAEAQPHHLPRSANRAGCPRRLLPFRCPFRHLKSMVEEAPRFRRPPTMSRRARQFRFPSPRPTMRAEEARFPPRCRTMNFRIRHGRPNLRLRLARMVVEVQRQFLLKPAR
jgi:hypothetical protein